MKSCAPFVVPTGQPASDFAAGGCAAVTVHQNTVGQTRRTAYDALVKGMRSLIADLGEVLANDDPRWLVFGFQMPATISTPGRPGTIAVSTDATGSLVLQCPPVPLATRYRWRTRLVGLQTDYLLAASTTQPLAVIPGVPPGQAVEIIVQAVNGNLQGVPSDPVLFILPALATVLAGMAPPVTATELVPRAGGVKVTNGANGHHGNGHAVATRIG